MCMAYVGMFDEGAHRNDIKNVAGETASQLARNLRQFCRGFRGLLRLLRGSFFRRGSCCQRRVDLITVDQTLPVCSVKNIILNTKFINFNKHSSILMQNSSISNLCLCAVCGEALSTASTHCLQNSSFLIHYSPFLTHNSSFLIQNSSLLMHNSSF